MSGPHRILAVKLADLGDVLLCTPALRALRQTYPQARLDALVTPHTELLIRHTGLVDRVIPFPKHDYDAPRELRHLARWKRLVSLFAQLWTARYDAVALFHHLSTRYGAIKWRLLAAATGAPRIAGLENGRGHGWLTCPVPDEGFGRRHEVEYALAVAQALGARTEDTSLVLPPFADEDERVAALMGEDRAPYIVIHAGSGSYSRARRWDPWKFAAVADALVDRLGVNVVVVGTFTDDGDKVVRAMRSPALNLQGQTDLADLAAVLRRCKLFIGADSGVMHLAAAVGVPVIALFGPSNHQAWRPWAPPARARVVRLGIPCSPCSYIGTQVGAREGCPQRACMADLGPEPVLAAAMELWRDG
ncbi:MAG: glycosyltransferase family 9 protein [Anaerolineae bacterium]|nr:glycosyltransferase family 9 protein [Anaerolineae bacterium]MDW8099335.1 glycosyltransferase family 9 protein [Anaerolineae bacterium]